MADTEKIELVITGNSTGAEKAFANARRGAARLRSDLDAVRLNTDTVVTSMRRLVGVTAGLVGVNLGAGLVRDTIRLADSWNLIDARIRNATKSQTDYVAAQRGLLEIANDTRVEYEAVAQLFARTNKFIEERGGTLRETLNLTRLVSQAAIVSGAGAQEQASTIRQLSQALASGVLRGDEFNSVMENAPRLAEAMAAGLQVPVGALRAMAEAGELTADVVTRALLGQADQIAAEFAAMPVTAGQALTTVRTEAGELVSEFDKANGVTAGLAEGLQNIGQNLPAIVETSKQLTAVGLAAYFLRAAAAVNVLELALKRFLPALIAFESGTAVLKLITAINAERLRSQQLDQQAASNRAQLVGQEHLLNLQALSLEEFNKLDRASQGFYRRDLAQALEVARLKLSINAGTNEKLAIEAARQVRLYADSLREIGEADGNRADAMKRHSDNVVKAKDLEGQRLQAVFESQKKGLQAAEKAFADAAKKREDIIKEFQQLQQELANPDGSSGKQILGYEVEKAVEDARRAQALAAQAPASQADALAEAALEKAREAGQILKDYQAQQRETGSSIDAAAAQQLVDRLGGDLTTIASQAAGVQEQVAQQQVETMQRLIQETLNQAEALKNIEVGFDESAAEQDLDAVLALLREKAQASPIKIPAVIVTGSLPDKLDLGDIPAKAGGGMIRGPGTGTSDSILARISNGEFVVRDAAVRKYGVDFLNRLNAGLLPRFASGGLIGSVSAPDIGDSLSPAAETIINLTLSGGGTYRVRAEESEASRLQRDLAMESLKYGSPR